MAEAGANWIDVGGESTRPGAAAVPEARGARRGSSRHRRAAAPAVAVGAHLHRHLQGGHGARGPRGGRHGRQRHLGRAPRSGIAAPSPPRRAPRIVLGHLRGAPATMMDDVAFRRRGRRGGRRARPSGWQRPAPPAATRSWPIPGIGFGKRLEHNLALLRALPALRARLGVPVMVGVSRKAFIGQLTGQAGGRAVVRHRGGGDGGGAGRAPRAVRSTTSRRCGRLVRRWPIAAAALDRD